MPVVRRPLRRAVLAVLAFASTGLLACDAGSTPKKASPPAPITISATLAAPAVAVASVQKASPSAATVLAGYQLYCVTFATPPAAAAATANEAGAVTLTLAASGVPFGCFILDPEGAGVATVLFGTDADTGQTASTSGDLTLGTITVNLTTGVAEAQLPAESDADLATTPDGVACPVGTWVYEGTDEFCGDQKLTIWVAKTESGYAASYTWSASNSDLCPPDSQSKLPATLSGGVLRFDVREDGLTCSSTDTPPPVVVALDADASCATAAISVSSSICSYCGQEDGLCYLDNCTELESGDVSCVCGSTTCEQPAAYTMVRQ